jgi:hypothetical protein
MGLFLSSSRFGLDNMGAGGASSALVWNCTKLVLGSGPSCTIEQMPNGAGRALDREHQALQFVEGPVVSTAPIQDGSASQTWNIEPAFPSFLTLDTASSRISQTTTTEDLPVMPLTKYEI